MVEKKLTDRQIKMAKGPARLGDGNGLYLIVRKPAKDAKYGSKSWSFLWIRNGRRREMGLGGYPALTIKEARLAADKARKKIAAGEDPIAERNKDTPKTFGEIADLLLGELTKTWKHEKHGAQWVRALRVLAKPIRNNLVSSITVQDVLRVVKPVYDKTPETGRRLRARIERVLDYATAHGFRVGDNPARLNAHFKILMGSQKDTPRKHYAAMPYADVPAFVCQLQDKDAIPAKALLFTILTAARTGETLGAVWDEIDLENALWTIPAQRMKGKSEHVVPLTHMALDILHDLYEFRISDYVFSGQKPRKPLSNMTMAMTMRRMGIKNEVATVHGFRSSFRDWAGDCTNAPREVAEAALAHAVGNVVERSYRRSDALEKRRRLMNQWSDYCAGVNPADVVRLHGGR